MPFGLAEPEVEFGKMPKPEKYNLQRLLEVRTRARESAIEFLAQKRAQLHETEMELATRKKAVVDCRKAQREAETVMMEKAVGGMKNSEIIVHRQNLFDLREIEKDLIRHVEQQKIIVERAEEEVEKALELLTEATKELQAIEKHRENWRREKKIQANRREQKIGDEIGAILHERQKFD